MIVQKDKQYLCVFQTISEDSVSMPDMDRNAYVPTGLYKVRLHSAFISLRAAEIATHVRRFINHAGGTREKKSAICATHPRIASAMIPLPWLRSRVRRFPPLIGLNDDAYYDLEIEMGTVNYERRVRAARGGSSYCSRVCQSRYSFPFFSR